MLSLLKFIVITFKAYVITFKAYVTISKAHEDCVFVVAVMLNLKIKNDHIYALKVITYFLRSKLVATLDKITLFIHHS